jgi:iron complex outermembrane receptor protein
MCELLMGTDLSNRIGNAVSIVAACLAAMAATLGQSSVAAVKDLASLSLEQLMQLRITTASLHDQSLADAPASVTVVTRQEIQRYGYRTLAEALQYVPGFYNYSDRTVRATGVRGMGLPGDFGSRLLVLVDGHNMASRLDGSNAFGDEFPIDLSLVKQIEIVRGPTSAL